MKTEFNPLEALADISEDELNELSNYRRKLPRSAGDKNPENPLCVSSHFTNLLN